MTAPSRPSHRVLGPVVFMALALGAAPAAADVISDVEAVCSNKTAGDACKLGDEDGHCEAAKCSRNDYSDGPPPKQVEIDCLVCRPGASEAKATPTNADAKATVVEPTKTAGESKTAANDGATKNTEVPETKGCGNARLGDPSPAIGSTVLGLALLGIALRGRSRRREHERD